MWRLYTLAALLSGCAGVDSDGDGVADDGDCSAFDASIFPGADELCDTIDNDCDGLVDDDDDSLPEYAARRLYPDDDGDGYGAAVEPTISCAQIAGMTQLTGDCDDGDPSVSPSAEELCDSIDNDCDGLTDSADDSVVLADHIYVDGDGDGYGDSSEVPTTCELPDGYAAAGGDCDDGDGATSPGALETCGGADRDCDGDPYTSHQSGSPVSISGVGYASLEDAVAAAASGDVVSICAGTHTRPDTLTISGTITLEAPFGARETSLTSSGSDAIVTLTAGANLTLAGLNLYGGGEAAFGGAVVVPNGGTLNIIDCILQNNDAVNGGAVAIAGGELNISGSTFQYNEAIFYSDEFLGAGGALFVQHSAVSIQSSTFSNNVAAFGGAIAMEESELTADGDSTLIENYVYAGRYPATGSTYYGQNGGAIYASGSIITLAPETILSINGALTEDVYAGGVGVALYNSELSGGEIINHGIASSAKVLGGGVYLFGGGRISDTRIDGNDALYGGGLLLDSAPGAVIERVDLTNNRSSNGGGIYCYGSDDAEIIDSLLAGNGSALGPGAALDETTFISTHTDWNDSGSDIYLWGNSSRYAFGEDASFSCDSETSCEESL